MNAPLPQRQRAAPNGTENLDIRISTPFFVSADTSTSGIAIALKTKHKSSSEFGMHRISEQ